MTISGKISKRIGCAYIWAGLFSIEVGQSLIEKREEGVKKYWMKFLSVTFPTHTTLKYLQFYLQFFSTSAVLQFLWRSGLLKQT